MIWYQVLTSQFYKFTVINTNYNTHYGIIVPNINILILRDDLDLDLFYDLGLDLGITSTR